MVNEECARTAIKKLEEYISNMPVTPNVNTYVTIYRAAQELCFQQKYKAVVGICNAVSTEN